LCFLKDITVECRFLSNITPVTLKRKFYIKFLRNIQFKYSAHIHSHSQKFRVLLLES
jgi:hypothetical protein